MLRTHTQKETSFHFFYVHIFLKFYAKRIGKKKERFFAWSLLLPRSPDNVVFYSKQIPLVVSDSVIFQTVMIRCGRSQV